MHQWNYNNYNSQHSELKNGCVADYPESRTQRKLVMMDTRPQAGAGELPCFAHHLTLTSSLVAAFFRFLMHAFCRFT